MMRTRASILVSLLWCVALLSLLVIGVLHSVFLDLLVVKNFGDRIQAHYLALAGVEKAKALLYQDARERTRSSRNHSGELYDAPQQFRDVQFGRGQFSVFHKEREDAGGGITYGISDEESRLNVNLASTNELAKLPGISPDIVAAIIDWRDEDNAVTPGGAEAEYYSSLKPPSLPRNGPLQTTRELLMVRGVSRDLFLGEGVKLTGPLELQGDEGDDDVSTPDSGWSSIVTVDSSVKNVNAAGEERVNVQSSDEAALAGVRGITADIAKAIVAYRGQNQLESIADLLDVPVGNQNQTASQTTRQANQAAQNRNGTRSPSPGPKAVSENLLMDIADDVTVESAQDLPGMVNVNTAGSAVLECLPGIDPELAKAIISHRKSSGFFPNTAGLLKVPGMNGEIFKQVAPRVCVRSETFRILSEGKVTSSGARQRIQVIVHVGLRDVDTLSYKEDL
ncbi:MAG: hypothetical protein JWR26_961 [Pedosphaera sp.]|nr:hypothetical protein [Pedosphaera sp.]